MTDFRNTNTLWASILVETLSKLGLKTAIICPGSRSTPLAVAFAQHESIEAIPVLDERSAAFFGLGIAKRTGLPTVLVCTSGTAGANFYPAIIEARESRVPLLVLTADRPPQLRECHSGQTIEQIRLYSNYPNWQTELAVPSAEISQLRYLRQTIIYAWERSLFPVPGVVHLNIPFDDPLAPLPDGKDLSSIESQLESQDFFIGISPPEFSPTSPHRVSIDNLVEEWKKSHQGIIIGGLAQPQDPQEYCLAIARLSQILGFPVLAEGLSPLRNYADLNPNLICTYDLILRNSELAEKLTPEIIIQIGELPTSKELRGWLDKSQSRRWIVDPSSHNFDPLHGNTTHIRSSLENVVNLIGDNSLHPHNLDYLNQWHQFDTKVRDAISKKMETTEQLIEGKVAWLLSQFLPSLTQVFIANSMAVRDVEFFWMPNNLQNKTFFSRGANGIDGTLSTALGFAYQQKSTFLLTGDLALLHDTNGFLLSRKLVGSLTIILINNNGGGIFQTLPIAKFEPPFEEFFATPQNIDFQKLSSTYEVEYQLITNWQQLKKNLNLFPAQGIRVLEIKTNRQSDAHWLAENLPKFATNILV
ncbi:2-succinyl-5-enolpyruvyl-6-hydroxy-3-cyclohexene-1-carboxylic-acid synthase [Merismopedia glauca]|uniref:2-succinyl-5-enolpyruvyl-6-hydroxy-3-cyclohexene-1-carboxylate synthase n=1 Tax=Merismopedia glauca CCAP 1448/3 TaxID=1296344 RepID=A0A2T1C0M2_9CYAN|nr:2-succinyl-5-enolpyruvyl-6-hydroxy-3-cyclohexene-1-carboxylic-acid synthase [Merismopedia glauca]PSB01819.1 2-succinyl-5-enolpyruvyl-6-hydroxy-3-cyclohexene-1-carboxylic-acid synthase [Merismopedia glauca CCAP 1448/3]